MASSLVESHWVSCPQLQTLSSIAPSKLPRLIITFSLELEGKTMPRKDLTGCIGLYILASPLKMFWSHHEYLTVSQ